MRADNFCPLQVDKLQVDRVQGDALEEYCSKTTLELFCSMVLPSDGFSHNVGNKRGL